MAARFSLWLRRAAGSALLLVVVLTWISLLGSSFTGSGVILADILLQSAGLASAVALLAPTLIGLDLACAGRAPGWPLRLFFFFAATLSLAGALSALPLARTWPLNNGLGGALGEKILDVLGPGHVNGATGLIFLICGGYTLLRGLGFGIRNLVGGSQRRALVPSFRAKPWEGPGFSNRQFSQPSRVLRKPSPRFGNPPRREPCLPFPDDEPRVADREAGAAPMRGKPYVPHGQSEELELETDPGIDAASRAIALRFAPFSAARKKRVAPGRVPPARTEPPDPRPSKANGPADAVRVGTRPPHAAHEERARRLEAVLAGFGFKGAVGAITPGPTVTLFEFALATPVRPSRVAGLSIDIARALGSPPVRVIASPGSGALAFELANERRRPVFLRDMLESEAFHASNAKLPVAIGMGVGGEAIVADLARMPHLLIAGGTGSGKSMGVHALVLSLLSRQTPACCRLLLIDATALELSAYAGIPHLLAPVVTDPWKAASALAWVVAEVEKRSTLMAKLAVNSLDAFNACVRTALARNEEIVRLIETGFDARTGQPVHERENLALEPLPSIVVVIDDLAELTAGAGRGLTAALARLARSGRAAGIHLVITTQRPSADIVAGAIKANIPARISYRTVSRLDSRIALDEPGAEQLFGAGDLLLSSGPGRQTVRLQGPFVSRVEIADTVGRLRPRSREFAASMIERVDDESRMTWVDRANPREAISGPMRPTSNAA